MMPSPKWWMTCVQPDIHWNCFKYAAILGGKGKLTIKNFLASFGWIHSICSAPCSLQLQLYTSWLPKLWLKQILKYIEFITTHYTDVYKSCVQPALCQQILPETASLYPSQCLMAINSGMSKRPLEDLYIAYRFAWLHRLESTIVKGITLKKTKS